MMTRALAALSLASLALAFAVLPRASRAADGQGRINPADVVQAAVLDGWRTKDGKRIAALELTLAPGWKTYWRSPGEAGIPPSFDWSGSTNLASVRIMWPRPTVFDLNGMESIGYKHRLVLPIEFTPKHPGQPIDLKAGVDLGVCHDICMPVSLKVAADLSGQGAQNPLIHRAIAEQPATPAQAGLTQAVCTVTPIADGLRLTAHLSVPPQGPKETTVVELPDRSIWISEAKTTRKGDRLTATVDMVPSSGGAFALNRSQLTITVLGAQHAVELHGCKAG